MNVIKTAIDRPIAVIAAVLMIVLFGMVALQKIPIQLAPDVNNPVISITTLWFGAAPAEVEREILNRQEEVMAGLEGLDNMIGQAEQGRSRLTLEFAVGTEMDRALLLVSNRLDRIDGYPDEAGEPSLDTAGSEDNPIAWFIVQQQEGDKRPVHEYGDFVEDVIKDRVERVPGVSEVTVYGGSEREIQVTVDPQRLARYSLTVSDLIQALRNANVSVSAGDVDEGKRRYVTRVEGELNDLETIRQVVVRAGGRLNGTGQGSSLARIRVQDLAQVEFGYKEPTARIRLLGVPSLAFNAKRETGANVIETMEGIREAIDELNAGVVPAAGLNLRQVYDETVYINSAIDLVRQNIWVGGSLAVVILLLFLRSWRATLIISIAIPVSVIGAFVAMAALGRSINVISLAGLAFAIGMVVDAAIVVLENIFRLRESGLPAHQAAYRGAKQVWGAVLVSAMTTVMVFIPILVMELEVGQLFRDIAVAIAVAVLLSLIVSITVIPALSRWLLRGKSPTKSLGGAPTQQDNAPGEDWRKMRLPILDSLADLFVRVVVGFVGLITRNRLLAFAFAATIALLAGYGSWLFLPKLEYLPEGNRNLVFGILVPPPGYNLETMSGIAEKIESEIRPLWASVSGPEAGPDEPPKIQRFFFVASRGSTFLGAVAVEPQRAKELIDVLQEPMFREPGSFGFINQPSIFGRGLGGGRKIELDISGNDLEEILSVAQRAMGLLSQHMPISEGNQLRPNPGLELGAPEIRVIPDPVRLADNGLSARQLADTIDVFNDGLRVAEVTVGADRIDLMLKGPENQISQTQGIDSLPIVTASGKILPANALSTVFLTAGPTEIRHRERFRTVTLEVRPAPGVPLEAALDTLEEKVMSPLQAQGLPPGVRLGLSGTADKLTQTWNAMIIELLLAVIIVYLVMAVLFESFLYPLIILISVPVAAAGGVAGLAILNRFVVEQPLDMLTLLGFVILVGIVVNNAILLVHQSLLHMREDSMNPADAIREATRNRIRPIFMSTLTSVFGMLPLVLFPGAGSELYRGLGSVVVGGLSLSAILTLVLIPPLLSLFLRLKKPEMDGAQIEKAA